MTEPVNTVNKPPKTWEQAAAQLDAANEGKLLDPDCRDGFKHRSCVGGPCQCACHLGEHGPWNLPWMQG